IDALQDDLLPTELKAKTSAERERMWPGWVTNRDRTICARVAQGDEDSIFNLLLFGAAFTKEPRVPDVLDSVRNARTAEVLRHRRIQRADDADGRVERFEGFLLNDGGEAFADTAGARVLVNDEDLVAVTRDVQQRIAVERHEAAQIEDARSDAVRGELLGEPQSDVHERAIGNDREIASSAAHRRPAQRNRR